MKKILLLLPIALFLGASFFTQSCNKQLPMDTLPAACDTLQLSYNAGIMDIINTSCAYSGCHKAGDAPGDFTTYQGMQSSLQDGSIFNRVVTERANAQKRMPPPYTPAGYPAELTAAQIDMLHCWLADNYPEN